MPKLTKRRIDAMPVTMKGDSYLWDSEVVGFGVRARPSGVKSYILQYRTLQGRSRRMTIGRHGSITAEQARKGARRLLGEVAAGSDPLEERRLFRAAPTVAELAERYIREHAIPHKKPRSVEEDQRNLRLHVLPALGRRRVIDVTRADAQRLHRSMATTPGAANRVAALMSKMLNLAEAWGLRGDGTNPYRHIKKYPEKKRERFLSDLELRRLGRALDEAEHREVEFASAIAAVRLLLLTGMRLGEVLTLRWDYFDTDRGVLWLPDSKTGPKMVVLGTPAVALLSSLLPSDSPWVFPGRSSSAHLVNLEKPWRRIRASASLEDVRLHDLRHTFASAGVAEHQGLPIIGALLGHRTAETTKRYAHLYTDPAKTAANLIAMRIQQALGVG